MSNADKSYSYDEVPYPNNPFRQSHPDRLASMALLFGMQPRPIDASRILELGCGRGGNLIPLAEQLPGSELVGVELSQVQINEARELVARLGLQNIRLEHMDLLDIDSNMGQFDYIICHGVFSWVPRHVQNKILDLCAANLAPQGVAYVSYNTFPGWHMRGMIRQMMCYRTQQIEDPHTRIVEARTLLKFLVEHTSEQSAWGLFLKSELETLRNQDDAYLFHEHLEDVNDPIYFYQFAERAQACGLQFLGETNISDMYDGHLPAKVVATLENVTTDLIQMEQYRDFLRNRTFRQTLLCHKERTINRTLKPASLESFWLASAMVSEKSEIPLAAREPAVFKHRFTGQTVTASVPRVKATLACLSEAWPGSIPFAELVTRSQARVNHSTIVSASQLESERFEIGRSLLEFYVHDLVELNTRPPCFSTHPGLRPTASRVARAQAEDGQLVTTLRHTRQLLNDLEAHLLPQLDGTRDRSELLNVLTKLIDEGVLVVRQDAPEETTRRWLAEEIERVLRQLAGAGLLIAEPVRSISETPAGSSEVSVAGEREQWQAASPGGFTWDDL